MVEITFIEVSNYVNKAGKGESDYLVTFPKFNRVFRDVKFLDNLLTRVT